MNRKASFLIFFLVIFLSCLPLYTQELPKLTLTTDRSEWKHGSVAMVAIGIENTSNKDLQLPTRLNFQLDDGSSRDYTPMINGVFYAPFSLTKSYVPGAAQCQDNLVERNIKRGRGVISIFPDSARHVLKAKETKVFNMNLNRFCWAHVYSSIYPSKEMFSAVKAGSYSLYFSMVVESDPPSAKRVESNRIRIEIK